MNERKHIEVVATIIRRHSQSPLKGEEIFATQRGYGEWKDWWEFPGGKMEVGESPEEALKREIREELATEIEVGELITTVEYDYPQFHLTLPTTLLWSASLTYSRSIFRRSESDLFLRIGDHKTNICIIECLSFCHSFLL